MQEKRVLGGNMAFPVEAIRFAREEGITPPKQEPTGYANSIY